MTQTGANPIGKKTPRLKFADGSLLCSHPSTWPSTWPRWAGNLSHFLIEIPLGKKDVFVFCSLSRSNELNLEPLHCQTSQAVQIRIPELARIYQRFQRQQEPFLRSRGAKMHLFLRSLLATTSKALATSSDALVPSSFLFLISVKLVKWECPPCKLVNGSGHWTLGRAIVLHKVGWGGFFRFHVLFGRVIEM